MWKRRRRTSFRRSARYDMQTIKNCRTAINFAGVGISAGATCDDPFIDVQELIAPVNQAPLDAKGVVFGGMHFQWEWALNINAQNFGTLASFTTFVEIWQAIVVLPSALPAQAAPAYLPALSDPAWSADADADILWKRIDTIPLWNASTLTAAQIGDTTMQSTSRAQGPRLERVRVKRRLNEQQGLYKCTSIVSGLAGLGSGSFNLAETFWARVAIRQLSR